MLAARDRAGSAATRSAMLKKTSDDSVAAGATGVGSATAEAAVRDEALATARAHDAVAGPPQASAAPPPPPPPASRAGSGQPPSAGAAPADDTLARLREAKRRTKG